MNEKKRVQMNALAAEVSDGLGFAIFTGILSALLQGNIGKLLSLLTGIAIVATLLKLFFGLRKMKKSV